MAWRIAPRPWTYQPQQAVGPDPSNALNAGLLLFYSGDGRYRNDVTGEALTPVNGPTKVANRLGVATNFVYSSAQYVNCGSAAKYNVAGGAITVGVWYRMPDTAGIVANGSVSLISKDSDVSGRAFVMDIASNFGSGNNGLRFYVNGGSGGFLSEDRTAVAGEDRLLLAVWRSGGACALYVDGRQVHSLGSGTSIPSTSGNLLIGAREYSGTQAPMQGDIRLAFVVGRAWSAAEVAQFYANPWQLFAPAPRRIYVPGASTTTITVQNAAHAHAADGATLSEAATLSVAGATHAHVAQAIALVQAHVLAVAAASHAHSAASPTLSEAATIAVADALHAQAADSLTLTQAHVLAVAAATHAHAAGSLELNQALTLAVADALHGHAAGSPALTQAHLLSVAGASHGHTGENVALTQANVLALASALHTHAAGQPTLTSGDTLDVAGAAHGHMAGAVELVQAHLLSVDGATHAHTVETFALSAGYTLAVANALHAHAAGAPTLTSGVELAVASALHLHAAGALDITQASTLVVSDALHAHLAELVRLRMPGAKARLIFVIQRQDRVLVVAPRNRTLTVH